MKTKHRIYTSSILLGLSSILGLAALSTTINQKSIKADAASGDKYIFVQVKDEDDLELDDVVIFAHDNYVISRIGGNPCYTYGAYVSGATGDYSKFNFETTSAAMFKVETGYLDNVSSYSFKCLRTASEETESDLKTANKYLSYAYNSEYHEDGHNIQTKGDVIFKDAKDEYSSWNVDIDSNGYVYLSRANESNRYGEEGVESPISVRWTNDYIKDGYFGYYFGNANIRMYRKVNVRESNLNIWISHNPDKTVYNAGEISDLTGLEISMTTKDTSMTFKSSYSSDSALFEALEVIYNGESSRGAFKWLGNRVEFSATVYPNREAEKNYYNTATKYVDLRGTYILAAPYTVSGDDVTSILDISRLNGEGEDHFYSGYVVDLEGNPNPISDSTYDEHGNRSVVDKVNNNVVTIVRESDGYFIKIGNDYLAFEMTEYNYGLVYRGTKAHSKPITVDYNNNIVIDGKTLTCDENLKKVYLNTVGGHEKQVELYRLTLKAEHFTEIESFRSLFFSKTATCDETGSVNNLSLSDWQTLSNEFNNNLSLDSQSYIASLTYSHNQEDPNSLKDMVDRYDLIVNKYSSSGFTDFMSRSAANTMQNNTNNSSDLILNNEVINQSSMITIIIIASVSTLSLFALAIVKKTRKEQ